MLNISEFIEVGYISKSHGVEGNIVLKINDKFPDVTDGIEFVFIEIDGGLVPFKTIEINLRNSLTALLKLEDVDTEDLSGKLIGCVVYFAKEFVLAGDSDVDAAIEGYMLIDKKHGEIGLVNALLNYKVNRLIQIFIKKKEILIPFNDELLVSIDNEKKKIVMDLPDGILDIND